jgi:hypothetical protein
MIAIAVANATRREAGFARIVLLGLCEMSAASIKA